MSDIERLLLRADGGDDDHQGLIDSHRADWTASGRGSQAGTGRKAGGRVLDFALDL